MEKLRMQSQDVIGNNVQKIAELFPTCVVEYKDTKGNIRTGIDFDMLKQILSDELVEGAKERYNFLWPDKRNAMLTANSAISNTLRPEESKSANFGTTENLYIEGDNLLVLKLLRENYLNQVKMIYIDPPYNTGSDFVYEDDFAITEEEYRKMSGDYDSDGNKLVPNGESNGRFHTDWLNMIYPRLIVAQQILADDGIIFISLDDNEIYNLKKVCDEVFGEKNFICNFVRKNKAGSGHDSKKIAIEYDYIMCYAKKYNADNVNYEPADLESGQYKLEDEHVKERGKYYLRDMDYRGSYSESGDYPITAPDGTVFYSGGAFGKPNTWRWSKAKFEWGLKNDFIVFKKNSDDKWKVYIKQYQLVDNCGRPYERTNPYTALIDFSNGQGSMECTQILGDKIFSFPKSSALLKHLLKIGSNKDSIVLDFFSGSATTAHAVMELNAEDGGNRKFIMVQLPEKTSETSEAYQAGYKTICEIGEERIRRSAKLIHEKYPDATFDDGFRVLKLDSSNMQEVYYTPDAYIKNSDLFSFTTDNVKEDRTPEDLLFQAMLEVDVALSSKIESQIIEGKKVFDVADGYLMACFDSNVNEALITAVAKLQPSIFVMRDSSMANDSVAVNFEQLFKSYSPSTTLKVF